jgi:antitoxin (DNA-binding transcriptional repressor) of toxin-antitoxin stability system
MGKLIGAAEFKAHCLRIMEEAKRSGETIVITKRGKPFMELKPIGPDKPKPLIGFMKGKVTWLTDDPAAPLDPEWEQAWEANNPPELYR